MEIIKTGELVKKALDAEKLGESVLDASDGKLNNLSKFVDYSIGDTQNISDHLEKKDLWYDPRESKIDIGEFQDYSENHDTTETNDFKVKQESVTDDIPLMKHENISYDIHTRNESLEGDRHPITGVPFERKTVEDTEGNEVTGVFPVFDSKIDIKLPEDLEQASDKDQFAECNKQLKEAIENDPEFAKQFTEEQLEQIKNGDTPDGYTWHHNEEKGKMQLVDAEIHAKTGHTGGKSIWGGGSDNR